MKALHRLQWTKTARNDLRQIVSYLKSGSSSAATTLLGEIRAQLGRLAESGRLVPELQSQGVFQFRQLLVSHWRIVYKIHRAEVYILAVFDARRNLEDLLLQRMLEGKI